MDVQIFARSLVIFGYWKKKNWPMIIIYAMAL